MEKILMYWDAGQKNKLLFKLNKTGQSIINYYENKKKKTERGVFSYFEKDEKIEKPKDIEFKYIYVGPDCYTDIFKEIDEKDIGKYSGFYEITPINIPKDITIELIVN